MNMARKLLKTYGTFLFCIIGFCVFAVNSSAYIECDGKINVYEWEECEQTVLFNNSNVSGNAYHSLCVKHKYIEEDRRVYLGILMENLNSEVNKAPENPSNEIYISFNDSSEITLCSDLTSDYNEDEFSVDFGYFADNFGGCTYELECVLKAHEYDEILTMNISVRDYNDALTQIYQVNIKSEEHKEEESESIAESEKESEKESKRAEKEKTTRKSSSKTTKVKTTKTKTTKKKETTTEYITAILTEEYESYSETVKENNRSILIISVVCVVTSLAAMCVTMFKKEKK